MNLDLARLLMTREHDTFISNNLSLGRALGYEAYTFRRLLLLGSCILAAFQYGMVLTNGVSISDFNDVYGLTKKEGDVLYSYLTFGACALSFIPGVAYDRWGVLPSIALAVLIFDAGLALQLVWTPVWPMWMSTMQGLEFCYVCFGCASAFFNVIACLAPIKAYPVEHAGKVNALVQVCMSLGITLQGQIYYALKAAAGGSIHKSVQHYLWYAFIFTNAVGVLMFIVFRACRHVLTPAEQQNTTDGADREPQRSLCSLLSTSEFLWMGVIFFIPLGFTFSFLNVVPRIADEVGASESSLTAVFGILNALGRLSGSIPLDYTRRHPLGDVFTYAFAGTLCFMGGIMFLVVPASPTREHVYIANALVSYSYGVLLGLVPPALRLFFGTAHLGVIYGILTLQVALAEPLWNMLFFKADGCRGVECFRLYYVSCIGACVVTLAFTFGMLMKSWRGHRQRCSADTALMDQLPRRCSSGDTTLTGDTEQGHNARVSSSEGTTWTAEQL